MEADQIAVHSDSFLDSDAAPLNLYQWFFNSLNTPIRLGPVHPGNRSVIVRKIVGETNTMEMQRDGVAPKVKKSLSKRRGTHLKPTRAADLVLKPNTSVSLSYADECICQ